jgi:Putative beta-barrel porin-2, OmpL-like. bbp2
MKTVSKSEAYVIASRRIAGTRAEKLAQIDAAIQELLDMKLVESAGDRPNLQFLTVPRRSHWVGMTMAIVVMLVLLVLLLGVRPAHAQTTDGNPAPQPDPFLAQLKFGATLEGYYEYNANRPDDRAIALRAYDTRSNTFGIQQAAFIVEQPPDVEKNRRYGLRLDFQFGQAVSVLQGSSANEPRPDLYRNVWQAYGTYIFPVGRGLQVDFGKFASTLGYETNYAKDDFNFSRAYLFNFLPYYHSGLRTTLPLSDRVTVMYMLTNGIQQTEDFNDFKSNHFTAIVKPVPAFTWTTSYYFGQEQPDNGLPGGPDGWFRVFDTNGTITATKALTFAFDVTHVTNEVHKADEALALDGLGAYARYQITPAAAVGVRYERLDDEGLFGTIDQVLQEVTLTYEHKLGDGFLVRAEYRPDWSNAQYFAVHDGGTSRRQPTALVGLVWWIGNKAGAW